MALIYKTPSECGDDFLTYLQGTAPGSVNPDQVDSDDWIRSRAHGGLVSGAYGDQKLIAGDIFPQSARKDAINSWLIAYFGSGLNPAQPAQGPVIISGTVGEPCPTNTQLTHLVTGNVYQTTEDVVIGANGLAQVNVQSVADGQQQNLLAGAPLVISSPPTGINAAATVGPTDIADGTDPEGRDAGAARVALRMQSPIRGGTISDYEQFSDLASPQVTGVSIVRFYQGLGTVGVVITSGTTDIDAAINAGLPIVRIPSGLLLAAVQLYLSGVCPNTDIPVVIAPTQQAVAVTVNVTFASGDATTVIDDPLNPGNTITQGDVVKREISRAIYKTPLGGRRVAGNTQGYLVKSEIEQTIDNNLGATADAQGAFAQIVADREVVDLGGAGIPNYALLGTQFPSPGTLAIGSL